MTTDPDPQDLATALDLQPLPHEGGLFRRTWANETASAILFLLADGDFSALHRLTVDEVYAHQAGAPLDLLLLGPSGEVRRVLLGTDVRAGQIPQLTVPAGWWQGSSSAGRWTLVSTVVSPPFEWDRITMGRRADLLVAYPQAADRISALTRSEQSTPSVDSPGHRGGTRIDVLLAQERAGLDRVPAERLADEMAAGALVIDTRPVGQRDRDGELPGAVVIDRNVLEWRLDPTSAHVIPEVTGLEQRMVVVCNEGYSSSLAAATLRRLGISRATDLAGGFQAWSAWRAAASGPSAEQRM